MCDACMWFEGKRYHRKGKKGYYFARVRLHRMVWESANGIIPPGHDIHHKDNDPSNNQLDNLELLTKSEHCELHAEEKLGPIRVKAYEGSRKRAARIRAERLARVLLCAVCGKQFSSVAKDPSKYCSDK